MSDIITVVCMHTHLAWKARVGVCARSHACWPSQRPSHARLGIAPCDNGFGQGDVLSRQEGQSILMPADHFRVAVLVRFWVTPHTSAASSKSTEATTLR